MASLFGRLAREEAVVQGEVAVLQQRLEEARERLRDLAITRKTLESLHEDDENEAGPPGDSGSEMPPVQVEPDVPGEDSAPDPVLPGTVGPVSWEEGRRRMLSLLATADQVMKARTIAEKLGEDVSTPARVETTRARLKKLVKQGQVVEEPVGYFAIRAGAVSKGEESAGQS